MKKKKILAGIGVILLFMAWFYWYEIRPAQIRHDCSWVKDGSSWKANYNQTRYKFCLHDHGL